MLAGGIGARALNGCEQLAKDFCEVSDGIFCVVVHVEGIEFHAVAFSDCGIGPELFAGACVDDFSLDAGFTEPGPGNFGARVDIEDG